MGFLDHATNNIIIDAVLTDRGRELLASNNGNFNITHYGFGDDEIDYSIIKKFGRTVGKEKIEKNTPIFEAQTLANYALKHPLLIMADPTLVVFPSMSLDSTLNTFDSSTYTTQTLTVSSNIQNTNFITNRSVLQDTNFFVTIDTRFFSLANSQSGQAVPGTFNATYIVTGTPMTTTVLSQCQFQLLRKATGSNNTSLKNSAGQIETIIKVQGTKTGVSTNIVATIQY
jgi:hypothetical protein